MIIPLCGILRESARAMAEGEPVITGTAASEPRKFTLIYRPIFPEFIFHSADVSIGLVVMQYSAVRCFELWILDAWPGNIRLIDWVHL